MDFSVKGLTGGIRYDLNGNIKEMLQRGILPGSSAPVDINAAVWYSRTFLIKKSMSIKDFYSFELV